MSEKYNTMFDKIVDNLIYKIPKYNYFISTNYSSVTFKSIISYSLDFSHGSKFRDEDENIAVFKYIYETQRKKYISYILNLCNSVDAK